VAGKIESVRAKVLFVAYGIDRETAEGRLLMNLRVEVTDGSSDLVIDLPMADVGRMIGDLDEVLATHRDFRPMDD
jgi:hypothetical protein